MESTGGHVKLFHSFWFNSDVFQSRYCLYNTLCSWNDWEENAFHIHRHILKEQMYPGSAFTPNSNMSMWLAPTSLRILHPVIQPNAGICLSLNRTQYFYLGAWEHNHPASEIPVQWEGCPDRCWSVECGGDEVQKCSGDSSKLFSFFLCLSRSHSLIWAFCLCNCAGHCPRPPLKRALAVQKAFKVQMSRCIVLAVKRLELDYCTADY